MIRINQTRISMYKAQKKILLAGYKKSHAWLFTGIHVDNIFEIANNYAKWILKSENAIGDLLILKEKILKIEHARKITEFLRLTTSSCTQKVIIISHFESMTLSAANAMLKILEETNQLATIIIITKHAHQVISTIRSRCFNLHFPYIDESHEDSILISHYRELLESARDQTLFQRKLPDDVLKRLICFSFSRIIKYHHGLLDKEIFQTEKVLLKNLEKSKIFWHYRWLQISEVLAIERELNVEKNNLLKIVLASETL